MAEKWAVVAIDWEPPNVLSLWDTKEKAEEVAEGFDALSLRATVMSVPFGHPILSDEKGYMASL